MATDCAVMESPAGVVSLAESQREWRKMLALVIAAAVTLGCLAWPAFGQLRGGSQRLGDVPVSAADVEAMGEIVGLSEEQAEIVAEMQTVHAAAFQDEHAKYREVEQGFAEEMRNRTGDPGAFVAMLEKTTEFRRLRDEMREDFFDEVRELVLTDEQAERWEAFERHHRRTRVDEVDTGTLSGGSVDLVGLVDEVEVDAEVRENLNAVLERYERELDTIIKKRLEMADRFSVEQIEMAKEHGMNFMAAMPTYERMFEESREVVLETRALTERYERLIAAALPEEKRAEFEREFKREYVPRVYRRTEADAAIETALQMDSLSEEQRAEIDSIALRYEREAGPLNDAWAEALLEHEAEKMTMMEAFAPGQSDPALREKATARRELDTRFIVMVRAVLNEEQREAIPDPEQRDWRNQEFGR